MLKVKKIRILFSVVLAIFLLIDYLRTDGKFSTISFIIIIVISMWIIISDFYFKNK